MEFNHQESDFRLEHIHKNSYRVIDKITRTWSIVEADDETQALVKAKMLIDQVFSNGRPNFHPRSNAKFVVLADSLSFRVGTHIRNLSGTGNVFAQKGDILTFDQEGEDNGFWYLDGNKVKDPQFYFKYKDGSQRSSVRGQKPWGLIWGQKIREII
jgi:hypothetical protein